MRKFIFPVLFLLLPVISFAQSSWYVQNSGTAKDLYSIFFINQNTGWTSGNNKLLKTSNSGYTWDSVTVGVNSEIRSVYFENNNTGWVCGTNGVILKTTNSGLNWLNQTFNSLLTLTSIYFISSDTGFVAGNGGLIYKTVNGGSNWTSVNPGFPSTNFTQIKFINSLTGFCTGFFNTSRLIKTTNAGTTWFEISPALGFGLSFSFINELTGWTSGANGTSKTTNGGTSWIYTEFFDNLLNSIQFINPITGYCTGTPNIIFKTTNGGTNWNTVYNGTFTVHNSVFAFDTNHVWACGTGGTIYYGGDNLIDTATIKYFPLKVGNSWTYKWTDPNMQTGYTKRTISRDTVIDNVTYYLLPGISTNITTQAITLDSLSGNIYGWVPGYTCSSHPDRKLVDSLAARKNDFYYLCNTTNQNQCTDTSDVSLFGSNIKTKSFKIPYFDEFNYSFGKGFGLIQSSITEIGVGTTYWELEGCVLDGIVHGDTSTTLIQTISGTVKFSDNNQTASNGYVKALKLNTSTGNIITYDSTQIGTNGDYILNHVPADLYYIVAYPNSEKQADFVPTYYPSAISWQAAVKVNSSNNPSNVNISVYRKSTMGGAYSVNGWVTAQTNSSLIGIKDAIVYIKQGNVFRDYFITQSSGQYNLNSLLPGNYEIAAERLGYANAQQNVSITNGNLENINFPLIRVGIQNITNVIPDKYSLYQNYPNPFNPVTNIKFDIPKSSFVTIKIYNVLGKETAILLNENKTAGSYEIDFYASSLTSGVYFYRLETEGFIETKRMVILK
ncbi:MAG: carboxypeptidase regulatory-like domain-containing protein [Ignavibacteria bacterium]|nr:carboxypeptidase regulatory-like domain-containing protein [Ignavibacteria bacterium]